jgi:hypothetical protein
MSSRGLPDPPTCSRPLVWTIAWSRTAVDEVISHVRDHAELSQVAEVVYTALSEDEVMTVREMSRASNLAAVLLVVEREAIPQESYRHWLQWNVERLSRHEDFRVFVCLRGMNRDDLMVIAASPDTLIADILDTVQISNNSACPNQVTELISFVKALPHIRETLAYRHLRCGITSVTGTFAHWIELAAAAVVLLIGTWVLTHDKQATEWPEWARCVVAMASGIIYAALVVISLFFLARLAMWHQLMRERRLQMQLFFVAFFGPWTIGLPSRIGAPMSWLILGVVSGILLDYARRAGLHASKSGRKVDPDSVESAGSSPSPSLAKMTMGRSPDALRCHLFEQQIAHVFISYTRSSAWACQKAAELNRDLQAAGVDCFLDRDVLVDGSNWRAQLNHHLVDANVFIALVDKHSIQRKWPAAELETALECRRINAVPDIILLVETGTAIDVRTLPVFRCILSGPRFGISENRPRVMELGEQTISVLSGALQPTRYKSTAVLPIMGLYLIRTVLQPIELALVSVGAASSMIGLLAGLLVLVDWYCQWNLTGRLSFMLSTGLAVTSAYLAGFALRLVLASRYEVNTKNTSALVTANVIGAAGLMLVLAVVLQNAAAIVVGWTLVATAIGWMMGVNLLHFSSIGDSTRFRRTPG